eukprot:1529613-Alexandrium_andersonii.AAC.1
MCARGRAGGTIGRAHARALSGQRAHAWAGTKDAGAQAGPEALARAPNTGNRRVCAQHGHTCQMHGRTYAGGDGRAHAARVGAREVRAARCADDAQ